MNSRETPTTKKPGIMAGVTEGKHGYAATMTHLVPARLGSLVSAPRSHGGGLRPLHSTSSGLMLPPAPSPVSNAVFGWYGGGCVRQACVAAGSASTACASAPATQRWRVVPSTRPAAHARGDHGE